MVGGGCRNQRAKWMPVSKRKEGRKEARMNVHYYRCCSVFNHCFVSSNRDAQMCSLTHSFALTCFRKLCKWTLQQCRALCEMIFRYANELWLDVWPFFCNERCKMKLPLVFQWYIWYYSTFGSKYLAFGLFYVCVYATFWRISSMSFHFSPVTMCALFIASPLIFSSWFCVSQSFFFPYSLHSQVCALRFYPFLNRL